MGSRRPSPTPRRIWRRLRGESVGEWSARTNAYLTPEAIRAYIEARKDCVVCGAEWAPMAKLGVCRRCYRRWLRDGKVWT